jgi:hypothetical protein
MATPTLESVIAELTALANALEKNQPNVSFTSAGKTYTGAEVIAEVRAILADASAVATARVALGGLIATHRKTQADKAVFLGHLKQNVRIRYGSNLTALAEFALEPVRKRGAPTTEEIVLRVTKSRATRKERRTMGKRQKAKIKGDVAGVVMTVVTAADEGGKKGT